MKKTNDKRFSNRKREELNGFATLLGIGFLAVFLIGMLTVGMPNASAATADTVNITTGIVENTSVIWISVEGGTQLMCIDNLCSDVHISLEEGECPTCPTCPAINFTELEGNITAKMVALEALMQGHNSSILEEEDKTWLDTKISEGASYSAAQVWESLNQSLMPSRRQLEDKDDLIVSLKNSLREMNNTVNLQGERIINYEKGEEKSIFQNRLLGGMLVIVMAAVLLYVFLDIGESVREGRVVLKGREGWTSDEKELKKLEEENERKEAELKKQRIMERGAELDREFAQHSSAMEDVGAQPPGGVGINPQLPGQYQAQAPIQSQVQPQLQPQPQPQLQSQPQNLEGMVFSDVDGTALIANYILAMDGYAHTRGDIERRLAEEGFAVDVEKVKRLSTNARRMVESLKHGKFVDGEQGRKPWRWIKWGKK